ncbi:MAG: hypothetical protein M0016_04225 [Deltaproteobacteria bacterium]|jgi:hypothetical protein|nr:cytochrome c [Deltaproteobacteria bacterium]MCL5879955.1 cytochrome c [Deltaproteobacteria bacterium]MDA8304356.1 hypothetical protein [Deltaproteobacteria bacterium]
MPFKIFKFKIALYIILPVILVAALVAYFYLAKFSTGTDLKSVKYKKNRHIFIDLGCVKCHSINALNIKGGHVGPDLSGAYKNVKKIYRENLKEFLKNPAGTMSFVLMFNHLTGQEIEIINHELKKAYLTEKKIKSKKLK